MKEAIEMLFREKEIAKTRLETINFAIDSLRALCEHDMVFLSQAHNNKVYECRYCKTQVKE
jgi:hypothetical protein